MAIETLDQLNCRLLRFNIRYPKFQSFVYYVSESSYYVVTFCTIHVEYERPDVRLDMYNVSKVALPETIFRSLWGQAQERCRDPRVNPEFAAAVEEFLLDIAWELVPYDACQHVKAKEIALQETWLQQHFKGADLRVEDSPHPRLSGLTVSGDAYRIREFGLLTHIDAHAISTKGVLGAFGGAFQRAIVNLTKAGLSITEEEKNNALLQQLMDKAYVHPRWRNHGA